MIQPLHGCRKLIVTCFPRISSGAIYIKSLSGFGQYIPKIVKLTLSDYFKEIESFRDFKNMVSEDYRPASLSYLEAIVSPYGFYLPVSDDFCFFRIKMLLL